MMYKFNVYLIFGEDNKRIVDTIDINKYDDVKNNIKVYEFFTEEEKDAFLKGVDEGIGFNAYQLLTEDEVDFIMGKFDIE